MSTRELLTAQLSDFDRKIFLNHSEQEKVPFVRNGTRDFALAMNALKSQNKDLQGSRAEVQAELIALRETTRLQARGV